MRPPSPCLCTTLSWFGDASPRWEAQSAPAPHPHPLHKGKRLGESKDREAADELHLEAKGHEIVGRDLGQWFLLCWSLEPTCASAEADGFPILVFPAGPKPLPEKAKLLKR